MTFQTTSLLRNTIFVDILNLPKRSINIIMFPTGDNILEIETRDRGTSSYLYSLQLL